MADAPRTVGVRQRSGYARLETEGKDARELAKEKWVQRLDWMWVKANAVVWVAVACWLIYYTNMFRVMWEHPLVQRPWFYVGLGCFTFDFVFLLYIVVYLEMILKDMDWEKREKHYVPLMTFVGFLGFCTFTIGLFPVWRWWTPVLNFVVFFGWVNLGHFLPSGTFGGVLMIAAFFAASATSHYIPHGGMLHVGFGADAERMDA